MSQQVSHEPASKQQQLSMKAQRTDRSSVELATLIMSRWSTSILLSSLYQQQQQTVKHQTAAYNCHKQQTVKHQTAAYDCHKQHYKLQQLFSVYVQNTLSFIF